MANSSQKHSQNDSSNGPGYLILVATPIGNMEDITARAVSALRDCDIIAAEDTRVTRNLLIHHGIQKKIISCYDANEAARANEITESCLKGFHVALVTSRGHPAISDPGYRVVRAALSAGVRVTVMPGPNAAISALAISGFPTDEFHFHGFLPRKGKKRLERIHSIAAGGTHVLHESPERVGKTLLEIAERCGNPDVALCRELTKLHEECIRGACREVEEIISQRNVLGELTLIVHVPTEDHVEINSDILTRATEMKDHLGLSTKDTAKAVSILLGIEKSKVYDALIKKR